MRSISTGSPVTSTRLDGKVALVTGIGSEQGIGSQIAIELAARGASVIINYAERLESAQEVVQKIQSMGGIATMIHTNKPLVDEIPRLFREAKACFSGHLDIVFSNAGIEDFDDVPEVTQEQEQVVATNTKYQFFIIKQAWTDLSNGGRLIIMSPFSATLRSKTNRALYMMHKSAVDSFVRDYATHFIAREMTVNCIGPSNPYSDETAGASRRCISRATPDSTIDDVEEQMRKWSPLGRIAVSLDIVRAVFSLVGEDHGWINGQALTIHEDTIK